MYKKVIDILVSDKVDYKALAIEIAKTNPSVFLKAYNSLNMPDTTFDHDLSPKMTASQYFGQEYGLHYYRNYCIAQTHYTRLIEKYGFESWLPTMIELLFPSGGYGLKRSKQLNLSEAKRK